MQLLMEYDFNSVFDLLSKLDFKGVYNFWGSGYDNDDECCCGGSCSCNYQISGLSGGLILLLIIGMIIKFWNVQIKFYIQYIRVSMYLYLKVKVNYIRTNINNREGNNSSSKIDGSYSYNTFQFIQIPDEPLNVIELGDKLSNVLITDIILMNSIITYIVFVLGSAIAGVMLFTILNLNGSKIKNRKADVPLAWGLYFQDGASPSFEGIVDLHNRIMFYLVVILFGVTWIMLSIMWNYNKAGNKLVYRYLNHGTLIELIWTVGPAFVLVAIAFPSFKLLYLMDEVIDPAMTVKVTGHQWYWEYEYADFLNEENETINFDSYMKDEASLEKGELRMLEVDNPVILPVDTHIRFIITAADVLHDWAVPALALKVDASPGRLNQASVIIEREGYFYGQCSEICGVLHSSMPIKIQAVEVEKFFSWLLEQ